MLQQVYLDTAYADATLADGTHVFALRDPITVPERHTLQVRLLNTWLPKSYYNIFEENDSVVLGYDNGSNEWAPDVTVRLPHGNRSVDDLVAFLNAGHLQDYVARYDEFTNLSRGHGRRGGGAGGAAGHHMRTPARHARRPPCRTTSTSSRLPGASSTSRA